MKNAYWKVNQDLAQKYSSPLDRKLYCDIPLIQIFGNLTGKSILDIGCGNGGLTIEFTHKAKRVVGVDTSEEMLRLAKELGKNIRRLQFYKASAEHLPFSDEEFNYVCCSMTINTFPTEEMVKNMFKEAFRVLKTGGRLGISLPHPLTLDKKTKFRWTEWKKGQNQKNLVPGEAVTRKIMGKNKEMLTIVNYYWPPQVLIRIAEGCGFTHTVSIEKVATKSEIAKYQQLDPFLEKVPFFLVMAFDK